MRKFQVEFHDVDQILHFLHKIDRMDASFRLASESYMVNGKSILGIFAIGLDKRLELRVYTENQDVFHDVEEYLFHQRLSCQQYM